MKTASVQDYKKSWALLTYGVWQLLQHIGRQEEIFKSFTSWYVQINSLYPVFWHIQVHELF